MNSTILSFALLIALSPFAFGQPATSPKKASSASSKFDPKKVYSYPFSDNPIYVWVNQGWMKNDSLFEQAAAKFNTAIDQKQNPVALAQSYKPAAKKAPFDSLKVYQYAYASYRAQQYDGAYASSKDSGDAHWMITRLPLPYNYSVARLRFLMESNAFPEPYLKVVGERLLQHNPNDYRVEFILAKLLDPSISAAEKARAFFYAKDLVQKYPNKPEVYGLAAKNYYCVWLGTKDLTDAKNAIVFYRKYLSIAPPNAPFRPQAEYLIKFMQSRLSTQGAKIKV